MGRRKGYCNKGGLGKAIGEPQTQTNRTQIVGVPGISAYAGYKAYNPESTVTEQEYYNGDGFESNFYTENEL